MPPSRSQQSSSQISSQFRNNLHGENAYERHQRIMRMTSGYNTGDSGASSSSLSTRRTEFDVLKDTHKFLRDDEEDYEQKSSWDIALARKYYDSLFKEFALCDLKHYKSGDIALRWRNEDEVVDGCGQFSCGNTRCAYHSPEVLKKEGKSPPPLITLELPFAYVEEGKPKSALVKIVLCHRCKRKLTWKRDKEKEAAQNALEEEGAPRRLSASVSPRPTTSERVRTDADPDDLEMSRHSSKKRSRTIQTSQRSTSSRRPRND